jgi:hypothetical protein
MYLKTVIKKTLLPLTLFRSKARVTQSVWQLGEDLNGRGSISGWGKKFSLLLGVHISSGAHPTSHLSLTGDYFPGVKTAGT